MKKSVHSLCIILFLMIFNSLQAQDIDLFKLQDNESKKLDSQKTEITKYVFKSTKIINGQSTENVGKGILDFRIAHKFGSINQGAYTLFGFDEATAIRFGLDYGITDRLTIAFGRTSYQKQYDAYLKYKILRQKSGYKSFPISLSYAFGTNYVSLKLNNQDDVDYLNKVSYFNQLLISRKFSDYFSLQLSPTWVHYNRTISPDNQNDLFAVGAGYRLRLSKRVNLTGEYFYQINQNDKNYKNTLSIGVDIETGGHVFQLQLTNTTGMTERTFINETTETWEDGNIHLGFNISRVFVLKKPKSLN